MNSAPLWLVVADLMMGESIGFAGELTTPRRRAANPKEWVERWTTPEPTTGCLLWCGGSTGVDTPFAKTRAPHRRVYEVLVGPIPTRKHLLHRCDNKWCVAPAHLYVGTSTENNRDTVARQRRPAKPRREAEPIRFRSWEEWEGGDWDTWTVPNWPDSIGIAGGTEEVAAHVNGVWDLPALVVHDCGIAWMGNNPDEWTEEDERSLIVLGHKDLGYDEHAGVPTHCRLGHDLRRSDAMWRNGTSPNGKTQWICRKCSAETKRAYLDRKTL